MVILRQTRQFRVETEAEAQGLIEQIKKESEGEVTKTTTERKEKKSKGVVIDEGWRVTVQEDFRGFFDTEAE